jgi:hypothetical protein
MAFPWPKKDAKEDPRGEPATPAPAADQAAPVAPSPPMAEAEPLRQLTERLAQIESHVHDAQQQVVDYLLSRAAPAAAATATGATAEMFEALAQRIEQLAAAGGRASVAAPAASPAQPAAPALSEAALRAAVQPLAERLEQLAVQLRPAADAAPAVDAAVGPLRAALHEHQEATAAAFRQLWQRVDDGLQEIAQYVRPAPQADEPPPAGNAEWQRAILGPELAANPALALARQQLLDGALSGDAAACSFAGQMLVFQSAVPEKMPPLLKEIGEAFYRWQPKTRAGASKIEEALVGWLQRACDDAGIPNTIELVNPGERFDAARHSAAERGVEITQVGGWIVLRDNGKVYTKALVNVK